MPLSLSRALLLDRIATVSAASFAATAVQVFQYQARHNAVYAEYLRLIGCDPAQVQQVAAIPFLPISLFKTQLLQTGEWTPARTFTSSGTTSATTSRHPLRDEEFYRQNARRGFQNFYGDVAQYCVLALLPAYLERQGSSLVFMADDFIRQSAYPQSGFFLDQTTQLVHLLHQLRDQGTPTLLLGVSFALCDLAEQHPLALGDTIVMETGGMKGRRAEITRAELHRILQTGLGVLAIHSEYGMTELLSQAYSRGDGLFYPAPTMQVLVREPTDPWQLQPVGRPGALNIVDLANVDTISFIATDDLGRVYADGGFEVLGRMDSSDVRGCNLLYMP